MDVVIPLATGSLTDYVELKYTLRGIEQFLPGHGNVFIVGNLPRWIKNVIHLPAVDSASKKYKAANIFRKIERACLDNRVSDSFWYFNDDHFLLMPFSGAFHYCGKLADSFRQRTIHQVYRNTLSNTLDFFPGANDFDTHAPILFQKSLFHRSVGTMKWITPHGFCIKTVYCAMNGIEGEYYPDLKINAPLTINEIRSRISGRQYFSIGGSGLSPAMLQLLSELYPVPSVYEI